jgi:glyoxylate utilization-related uncharacterized protein
MHGSKSLSATTRCSRSARTRVSSSIATFTFLIEGEITVTSQGESVTLSGGGQATSIPSPLDPPGAASARAAEKVARAVATVSLH